MKGIKAVSDVLPANTSAIVIFTRGHVLAMDKTGRGHTGNWKMNPNRDFDVVLLYLRGKSQEDNTIFLASPASIESTHLDGRYLINLTNIREVAKTSSDWHTFIGAGSSNPVFYADRKA
jgi:hypothetical protein